MKRLRHLLRLAPADRSLLIQSVLLVGAIRLGLWLLPFRTVRSLLGKVIPSEPRRVEDDSTIPGKIAWAVETVARYVPAATCLTQALAAQVLLNRRGLPAQIHIGVCKGNERQLQAHAWVESGGRSVVGGRGLEQYAVLAVLSADDHPHSWHAPDDPSRC